MTRASPDLAERDIEKAVDWYRDEAGVTTALRFVDEISTGSPGLRLEVPGSDPGVPTHPI